MMWIVRPLTHELLPSGPALLTTTVACRGISRRFSYVVASPFKEPDEVHTLRIANAVETLQFEVNRFIEWMGCGCGATSMASSLENAERNDHCEHVMFPRPDDLEGIPRPPYGPLRTPDEWLFNE